MAYATKQDMIDRFDERTLAQLTDRGSFNNDEIDDGIINNALQDATDFADGYLAKSLKLPLSPVPTILTRMICDIAFYYLNATRIDKDSPIYITYVNAEKWLSKIASGALVLEQDGLEVKASGNGGVQISSNDRVFTRDSLDVM